MTASIRTIDSHFFSRSASAAATAARIATRSAVASVPERRRPPLNTPSARRLRERLAEVYSAR